MLAVIAGALAARRAHAVAVLLLSVLAGAAAAVAPMYAAAAGRVLADAELSAATPEERRLRFVAIQESPGMPGDPARSGFADEVEQLAPAGFDVVFGSQSGGVARGPAAAVTTNLVFRTGICERVVVTGRCPASTTASERPEVMVSAGTAAHLKVAAGGEITFKAVPLRVSGVYRPVDATDPYWMGHELLRAPAPGTPATSAVGGADDAIFTAESARLPDDDALLHQPTADVFVTEHLLHTQPTDGLRTAVSAAGRDARQFEIGVGTALPNLLDRIALQRDQLAAGVTLGAALLVLLCWLVLFVAVSSAADERRPEQGLLLLRGLQRRRLWALAIGEHAAPALAAIPLGCLAGLAATELLAAHTLTGDADVTLNTTAIGYATVAAVGALVAVLLAQARTLAAPVVDLLRRVPARARGWRASAADLVAVSLAAAAAVQLRAGGSPSGLALLAPVVGALAVSFLLARVAMLVGAAAGAALLARGRTRIGLPLVQVARQPRFRPLIALLTVVVAMLAFTVAAREVASAAYADRATLEVGAPRVVGVDALSRRHLLEAVRAVDPERRFAMATVVTNLADEVGTPVLAVDSDRLAAVVAPHPSYGADLAKLTRTLRPDPLPPILLRGRLLTVDLTASYDEAVFGKPQPRLYALIASTNGTRRVSAGTPIVPGRKGYSVAAPECASECRLVGFEITTPLALPQPLRLQFNELRSDDADPVQVSGAEFAELNRWRMSKLDDVAMYGVTEGGPALGVEAPDGRRPRPISLRVADTPELVPGWLTRSKLTPVGWQHPYEGVDSLPTTAWVVGQVDRLPRLGGTGLLVDLDYVDRPAVGGQSGVKEVWLGPAAPADVLDRLRERGLVVRYDRTIPAARADFDRQAPSLALTFNLFAALAGVLIGAGGLVAMAAAEQRNRVAMLVALRRQGVPARAVRGSYGWPVAVATAAGGLATVLIWMLARSGQRFFVDGRSPVPVPVWPDAGRLVLITVPAVAVFAVTAAVLGQVFAASVRRRSRR
ncbi:FtsX-like permease family protein [Micromonospora sp. NPDC051006]|uniref:FtsX-like permease family protein n=1 Tax=Micromonospora sp. NPDC051006 TaxID=3364283 RepID=UPI003788C632